MKILVKISLMYVLILFVSVACSGSKEKEQWAAERDSLEQLNHHQRQVLDEMTFAIVEISNILDTINMQERLLFSSHDVEGRRYTRKQVIENLKTFENILQEKRSRIRYLDSMMHKNNEQIKKLSSLVNYLHNELDKKDSTIKVLRTEVESKNFNIRRLNQEITTISANMSQLSDSLSSVNEKSTDMQNVIDRQAEDLYAVYYVIGTRKELENKGVMEGGRWLGLEKVKINSSAIYAANKIDSRELKELSINGSKPKILTDMPTGSYSLNKISKDSYKLVILDAQKFWSVSKLLIIQVR